VVEVSVEVEVGSAVTGEVVVVGVVVVSAVFLF
jgi:hypothetical protein